MLHRVDIRTRRDPQPMHCWYSTVPSRIGCWERVRQALPDLLVPIAVLALTSGDDARAAGYVAAIRSSPYPTQSLHTTCLYRQLRERLGPRRTEPGDVDVEEVSSEAMAWLKSSGR